VAQPNDGYKHNQELRARIQAFSPDEPGIVFPFSARLARENGWARPFAERVVEEYRRFLYLAMTAGHPVTPSVQVDQAWHQHLTCTRSYWDDLCGRVLGRPLHHEPTKGGTAEGEKFVDWYARTLDSYRAAFAAEPPRDVWPTPAERFASEARIVQVSAATHWIIRKPRLRQGMAGATAGMGALLLAAACTGMRDRDWMIVGIMLVVVVLFTVAGTVQPRQPAPPRTLSRARRRHAGRWGGGGGGGLFFGDSGSSHSDSSHCGDSGDGGGDCGDGGGGCGGGGCGGGCGGCGG
jgi:hypothetical protein